MIRDSFTITVKKDEHKGLYDELVDIIRPEFDRIGKSGHLSYVLESVGQSSVTMCPPATAFNNKSAILEAFKRADYQKVPALKFPIIQNYENIQYCSIFVSSNSIEITPPFVPSGKFEFLTGDVRRIYLSATIEFETDFVRAFGRRPDIEIRPKNDAGNGERLIIFGDKLHPSLGKQKLAKKLAASRKVLIAIPTYSDAKHWALVGTPPDTSEFTDSLEKFRQSNKGTFLLVSRIDGIDLPQDTCRIMVIDGAPSGISLMERYMIEGMQLSNLMSTKMATRITQLLGRINRGRSDYGIFFIYGQDISRWFLREKNVALLPELIQKQVELGNNIHDEIPYMEEAKLNEFVDQVLTVKDGKRDDGWVEFYSDSIKGIKANTEAISAVKDRETKLASGALAECEFMTALWSGDIQSARNTLSDVIDKIAITDARVAGWYSVWLGMTYEIAGDPVTAGTNYRTARSRLSKWLNLPYTIDSIGNSDAKVYGSIHKNLIDLNSSGTPQLADFAAKMKVAVRHFKDPSRSAEDHEEALRFFGELIGLESTRPDNEFGSGPDVVWHDPASGYTIAFELKTKKDDPALYFKKEVGQAMNHIGWMAENRQDDKVQGVVIVGPPGKCDPQATPVDEVYLCEIGRVVERMESFVAKLDDFRARITAERNVIINEFGTLAEWQLEGWFSGFASKRLKELR
ncbi:hypothetical protein MRS76_23695 [Rhizobiaceae bacterium n13]|uniref:ATP-dependent helicase C-terminal domain-containing protein n=1 Tax=Ferirhizobium litorale TaxID=2927786 RepID=A0AAE3QKN3_9HYPH|nr:helicase C-terminal domain-containing protein [Fererhizobium litorale]MDI7864936.1 hypothetical protein [Fererhizobium litorale]MDI7925056.1 hypothetical protein [Fererhizobium litorale]